MFKKIIASLIVFFLVIIAIAFVMLKPYYQFITGTLKISPFQTLFFDSQVKKIDDSVNILVLGIAGDNHDGPNLSDSIMVLHYNFKTDHLDTIGIPRDIWSGTLRDKINSAYAYGEAKQIGGGLKLAKAEVGAIVGMPIQYSMVVDFSKYKELIDYLGGIDVEIKNSFTDNQYPIDGKENDLCGGDPDYKCRYETITFQKGKTHMDGTTALKFVRSRNAEGDEGSDFARSRRQQLVITAIKDNVIKIVKSYNINNVKGLYDKINSLVIRDVTNQQLAIIAKDVVFSKKYSQKNFFLPEDMFTVPDYSQYDGQYVLVPSSGFDNLHKFVQCLIEKEDENKCSFLENKRENNK